LRINKYIPIREFLLISAFNIFYGFAFSQDLNLIDEDNLEEKTLTIATFKTNRIVNGHSIEMVAKNEFDFKISHRFGLLHNGLYDLFGLDQASMRMGGDFGITDNLNIGLGRSTVEKTYDGFIKYKFLKQSKGPKSSPLSGVIMSHMGINTLKWIQPERKNLFSSRLHYTHQLLLARKFSNNFSAQITPTLTHLNIVKNNELPNDVFSIGMGARQKLFTRVSVNLEYYYVFPNQLEVNSSNSLSMGFDIETGGHVFQLFFTNSYAPFEKGFITDTKGKWIDGDIRFGFNIARIFDF
jgi:hypothetical protein